LAILLAVLGAARLHCEARAEDVGELGSVAILAPDDLLLALCVVPAGQELPKDELGCVDLVLWVLLHRNAVAVILHADLEGLVGLLFDDHINVLDRSAPLLCRAADEGIAGVHQDLVKQLVESRIERYTAVENLAGRLIPQPPRLCVSIGGTNVGVRQFQDVLAVSMLLISGCVSHFCSKGGGLKLAQFYCTALVA